MTSNSVLVSDAFSRLSSCCTNLETAVTATYSTPLITTKVPSVEEAALLLPSPIRFLKEQTELSLLRVPIGILDELVELDALDDAGIPPWRACHSLVSRTFEVPGPLYSFGTKKSRDRWHIHGTALDSASAGHIIGHMSSPGIGKAITGHQETISVCM